MSLRHAVALALVGWYLIIPPESDLSDFQHGLNQGSFDTAKECAEYRAFLLQTLRRESEHPQKPDEVSSVNVLLHNIERSVCISTDDPRLKP